MLLSVTPLTFFLKKQQISTYSYSDVFQDQKLMVVNFKVPKYRFPKILMLGKLGCFGEERYATVIFLKKLFPLIFS